MLKNELKILTRAFGHGNGVSNACGKKNRLDFSKVVIDSCNHAKEAWETAAFSNANHSALCRYFNYHFNFLNALVAENSQVLHEAGLNGLYGLMEHLLIYYREFIDQQQPVALEFLSHRSQASRLRFEQFVHRLDILNVDQEFKKYLTECLSDIFSLPPVEQIKLAELFYREELIANLAANRNSPELMSSDRLIDTLISLNFNHAHFFSYLRKRALKGLSDLNEQAYTGYFLKLRTEFPKNNIDTGYSYDPKWPHIHVMYMEWLNDYHALLALTVLRQDSIANLAKVPLTISVKQLACLIRALYESDFYGNISLTAIFDHTATVFTTKRQEHISAESISNAYYALSQSAALRVTRMLGNAVDFLKPYCFPV